ncbi:MAG: glutathione peroxidase [Caulobacterales bacterium]|nr:glutathione peroxidase [Caulobacterales bacterium]
MRVFTAMFSATLIGGLATSLSVSAPIGAGEPATAHSFAFTSIDGEPLPLSTYDGEVVLVVNTASQCGFTPQYEGLQTLWSTYEEAGLVVLGVPSDDFAGQELDTEAEVKEFCEVNFGITFPMTSINVVKNDGAHAFYDWVRAETGADNFPEWNFNKVLISRQGDLLASFNHLVEPESDALVSAIEAALQADA